MVKLICAVVGVAGSAFPVDVDAASLLVGELKELIQRKKPDTIKGEADALRLFLGKHGDTWVTEADVQKGVRDTNGLTPLDTVGAPLNLSGLSEEDVRFEITKDIVKAKRAPVHVLVVIPGSSSGESMTATTTVEMLGKRHRTQVTVDPIDSLNELVAITEMAARLNPGTDLAVGNLLNIPESPLRRFPTGLYVRKEYWDLHKMIKQRLESKDKETVRILVIGSPGIGKSVFGVFVLLLLMMEKKDVAYRPLGDLAPHYFSWNGTKYVISEAPRANKKYVGLVDGDDTGGTFKCHLFDPAYVFASPRPKNYNHFVKDGCLKVYMNPWTRTECQGLADALHLDVQVKNKCLRMYDLVGGKPRIWFSPSRTYESLMQQVKADIPHDMDGLKRMIHLFRQGDFDERTRHNLFSICRDDDDPSRSYLAYSSLAVEAMICARYELRSADQARSLLQPPRRECAK